MAEKQGFSYFMPLVYSYMAIEKNLVYLFCSWSALNAVL